MKTLSSAENYLEAIYILSARDQPVRAVDIAGELEFTKPSVSVAMRNLREGGYIEVDGSGHITLTERGYAVAKSMYDRHTLISQWLMALGVDAETASEDACKIEHDISEQSFEALCAHFNAFLPPKEE